MSYRLTTTVQGLIKNSDDDEAAPLLAVVAEYDTLEKVADRVRAIQEHGSRRRVVSIEIESE